MNQRSLLDPWPWSEGSYEIGSVCPYFHTSVCLSGSFLGIWSLVFFLIFGMEIDIHVKLCVIKPDFSKKFSLPQKWAKRVQNGPKMSFFFHISENFVIIFGWKWSKMKYHIVIGLLPQTSFLSKFWLLRYGPKSSQPISLQDFKMAISQGQNDELG